SVMLKKHNVSQIFFGKFLIAASQFCSSFLIFINFPRITFITEKFFHDLTRFIGEHDRSVVLDLFNAFKLLTLPIDYDGLFFRYFSRQS
ncbi:MAG: hypothetical protein ACE5I8_07040, partial [Thermodesulfobacteriota bacterium]